MYGIWKIMVSTRSFLVSASQFAHCMIHGTEQVSSNDGVPGPETPVVHPIFQSPVGGYEHHLFLTVSVEYHQFI